MRPLQEFEAVRAPWTARRLSLDRPSVGRVRCSKPAHYLGIRLLPPGVHYIVPGTIPVAPGTSRSGPGAGHFRRDDRHILRGGGLM